MPCARPRSLDGTSEEIVGKALHDFARRDEIVLATNPTVEGEATAHYIAAQLAQYGVAFSRLAYGVPMGGELEYVDGGTLSRAFNGRQPFASD